jgi:hypothetical protein
MSRIYEVEGLCVYCGEDVTFGSGRFVNRVVAYIAVEDSFLADEPEAADFSLVEGYACAGCFEMPCDECGDPIALDEDYRTNSGVYHYDCLTPELMAEHAALYALDSEDAEEMISAFLTHYESVAKATHSEV